MIEILKAFANGCVPYSYNWSEVCRSMARCFDLNRPYAERDQLRQQSQVGGFDDRALPAESHYLQFDRRIRCKPGYFTEQTNSITIEDGSVALADRECACVMASSVAMN